jgi:hypothetical protein
VLQHWHDLRLPKEKLGDANSKRFVAIKNINMVYRRQGLDALRGEVLRAATANIVAEPVHYIVGAGLFTERVEVETFVRLALDHQRADHRVAATYGAVYYMASSDEVACNLGERVVLEQGDPLVLAAARDVLDIWCSVRAGRRCDRCGQMGSSLSTQKPPELTVRRGS